MFSRGTSPAMSARVCPVNECHWRKEGRMLKVEQDLAIWIHRLWPKSIDRSGKCKQKMSLCKDNKKYGFHSTDSKVARPLKHTFHFQFKYERFLTIYNVGI